MTSLQRYPEGSLLSLRRQAKRCARWSKISPDPTEGEGSSLFIHDNAASTLKRLPLDALTPLQDMERTYTESVASNPDFAAIGKQSNRLERVIGMVVHRVFELLAREEVLPKAGDGRVNHWIRTNIHFHSLPPAQAQSAFSAVRLVSLALSCEVGRWILNARSEAYSEVELTRLSDNEVTRHVVDRTFYDEASGIRWVIDFKTSEPAEGESLSSFEAREHALYGPQLENYAALVADLPLGEERADPEGAVLPWHSIGTSQRIKKPGTSRAFSRFTARGLRAPSFSENLNLSSEKAPTLQ